MTVTITVDALRRANVCGNQLDLFMATFGESLTLNSREEAVERAKSVAHLFDFPWAAYYLLTSDARVRYKVALRPSEEAYEEATRPARLAHEQAVRSAREKYAGNSGWHANRSYRDAVASAWKVFVNDTTKQRYAYEEAVAAAFAGVYWDQEAVK